MFHWTFKKKKKINIIVIVLLEKVILKISINPFINILH